MLQSCRLQWANVSSQHFSTAHAYFVGSWNCSHLLAWQMTFLEFLISSCSQSSRGKAANQHSLACLAMISISFSLGSVVVGDHAMKCYLCCVRKPALNDLLADGQASEDWPFAMHDHTSISFNIPLTRGPLRPKCCTSTLPDFHWAFDCLQTNGRVYFPAHISISPDNMPQLPDREKPCRPCAGGYTFRWTW